MLLLRGRPAVAEQALQMVSAIVDASDPSTVTATFNKPVRPFDLADVSLSFSSGTPKNLTDIWGTASETVRLRTDAPIEAGDVFDLVIGANNSISAFGDNSSTLLTASLPDVPTAAEATHWVDPVNGDDTNDGSSATPWATVPYARANAGGGAVIALRDGNYGMYDEASPPAIAETQTILPDEGHTPTFTRFRVSYASRQQSYLLVCGIKVVNPVGEYWACFAENATGIRFSGMDVSAEKPLHEGSDTIGFHIEACDGCIVDWCKLYSIARGIRLGNSADDPWIVHNSMENTAGACLQWRGGNTGGLIAYNYAKGMDYDPDDPDTPADPHIALISIRSDGFTIACNHMHSNGNSAGIMTYNDAGGKDRFDNMVVENNLFYDTDTGLVIRFNELGVNMQVRNNLAWYKYREDLEGGCDDGTVANHVQTYFTPLIVHELVPDSEGLHLHNNILVGAVSPMPGGVLGSESNNYCWSWAIDGTYQAASPSGTSEVVEDSYNGCGTPKNTMFEDGSFFHEEFDAWFPTRARLNFRYADGSPAWNFGNPAEQAAGSIGTIGEDGFMLMDGPARDASRHSVGPYEAGVEAMGAATVAVDNQVGA